MKKTLSFLLIFLLLLLPPALASPQQDFLNRVAPVAQEIVPQYGLFPSVFLSQAALESGWGRSWLATNVNNYFGRKCLADPCVEVWTPEYRDGVRRIEPHMFQVYLTLPEAIHGYCRQFFRKWKDGTSVYNFDARSPEAFARSIWPTYASDPKYVDKVIRIIRQYDLTKYDRRE
jgi:flagellum-specific peptidoglycan hydrolase FlgJ